MNTRAVGKGQIVFKDPPEWRASLATAMPASHSARPNARAEAVIGAETGSGVRGAIELDALSLPKLVMSHLVDAVFVLDGRRRIAFRNAKAERYLEARFLVGCDSADRLVFLDVFSAASYQRSMAHVSADRAQLESFSVTGACSPSMQVSIKALEDPQERDLYMVLIRNLDEANALRAQWAIKQFSLTPSESRVLQATLRGMSPAECAENTGLKITTVRTQLAALFAKTGARRQAELIAKIMQQPLL